VQVTGETLLSLLSQRHRVIAFRSLLTCFFDAVGTDIGAREICVAVPPDRPGRTVRCFETFTEDLLALRDWLQESGVTTVAMEATSEYWIPLFQILEAAGLEVCLVNARHCKNLPGRKTDVRDGQWLQYLRAVLRHRDGLVKAAARCVNHLHKSLTQ
jgi:transposase